ncbi:hypothetical protein ALC56_01313 [Trachymyrmex septentrionalis]|uniref:Uncharacterized protein n=1 Tax=Trachymyrmex septentrionalis TaxID=34720 RepID=A0A151K0Q0_9HYME|nr:hypothetical protein ALC56_01313 [Trachymyrmex septentrionalis]
METQKILIYFSHQEAKSHQEDEEIFSRKMDYLIDALSKIAKVQSFEKDPALVRRLMANVYNATQNKSAYLRNRISTKNINGTPTHLDTELSSKLSSSEISDNSSSNGIGQENFHYRAMRNVYISKMKENIPSYACTSGGKMFNLSSKRFFQDRRSYFNFKTRT